MLSTEYRRDLAITVGIVLLFSGVMVIISGPSKISLAYALFAAGPFAGWILWASGDANIADLWGLIPLTFFSIWPAVRAAKASTSASRRVRLALSGSIWLFSSTFYLVLMWI